ncbi:hypothetical protein V6N12_075456 [Hibiscus sabdariffa]|uniref:Uncharacterized protein n=1 Tax=Hibiscus sabdariffa TaxID=183260 RepID=A0ABR2C957_9ROSI
MGGFNKFSEKLCQNSPDFTGTRLGTTLLSAIKLPPYSSTFAIRAGLPGGNIDSIQQHLLGDSRSSGAEFEAKVEEVIASDCFRYQGSKRLMNK